VGTEPAASPFAGSSVQRMLIEALAKGEIGRAQIKELLANAPMAEEQRSLVEMLMSLDAQPAEPEQEASPAGPGPDEGPDDETRPAASKVDALKRELADLREVNDTLAAALGACRVCWGGDDDCPECAGRGRPGSKVPDPALFRELVVPAVRRVRSLDPAARPASRRSRMVGSKQWRHSHEW
jgi:hypothetical protein